MAVFGEPVKRPGSTESERDRSIESPEVSDPERIGGQTNATGDGDPCDDCGKYPCKC
jgi:hypothetical protein